ncbi:PREDICTED: cytochrome P450 72C1-like [Tarenaya hassleriana]|uniref:cytochrome P450 72C1-like n=1 Tax=Tarenaya hassleriana TaxID=28532 RepID=UPI00053C66EC|nr:PREDICTED: cytochrome P450 72C1-like [Tarenaya hassleriana]
MGTSVWWACVASVLLVAVWAWRGLNWVWLKPKRLEKRLRGQGFSGNSYRVLVGDLWQSSLMDRESHSTPLHLDADIASRLMPFFHHTVQKYGKKCFTWFGPFPNVIIMDPEILREIFSRHELWPKPTFMSHAEVLVSGLVLLEGQEWSKHRKFLNPTFRTESLKNLFRGFYWSCVEMLEEWERLASANGSVELDSWSYCLELSKNMLARAVFGDTYKDGAKIFEIQQEHIDLGLQVLRSIYIPGYRYLPTKFNKRLKDTGREVKSMLKAMIKTKEMAIDAADKIHDMDLLSSMLVSNSKLIKDQGPAAGLTLDDIVGNVEQFYEAGQSATSSLFVWTLVMLCRHQDWQDRARDEVLRVFGKNEPDFDGLSHLKIVTMILNEVLRLYPPAYFTSRMTKQEMKLEKFTLPEGIVVTIPMILVHHDTDLWGKDAKEFKPERFANGVAAATNGKLIFFPFGSGPRVCIGQNFSMVEAKLFLVTLLRRFRLEISPAYTHAPFPVITTLPQHGAHIIIRKLEGV